MSAGARAGGNAPAAGRRRLRLAEPPSVSLPTPGERRGPLARAGSWLLEPVEPDAVSDLAEPASGSAGSPTPPRSRPVVAVFGLAPGCGASTLARALACALAARDLAGAAAVSCSSARGGLPLALPAASRLARLLADLPGAHTRAFGRLCLVSGVAEAALADTARHHAPLVLDAGSALGGVAAAVADHTLLLADGAQEPALASLAASCLARVGPPPLLVVNRGGGDGRWEARAAAVLPDSRLGAQLALGGREPRGELGRVVEELADMCCGGAA